MIDPSMDTLLPTIPPTYEELALKVIELESNLTSMTQNWQYAKDRVQSYARQISQFEEWLKNQIDENNLDKDAALEAAEIFGIHLEKDYDVTVTVTFSGSVKVPYGFDMEDDFEDNLKASLEATYYGHILESDFMEYRMDIDYQESY